MTQTVIGLFPRMDTMLTSARRVRIYDIEEITLLSPVPLEEEAEDLLPEKKKDPVRFYTFFGSLTGLFAGALFAVGVSILYPLPRGGRPIAVIPPTLIISFETLILFGVLATFAGFLILSGLIPPEKRPWHNRIGEDRFAVLIRVKEEQMTAIEQALREGGAEEIVRIEDND